MKVCVVGYGMMGVWHSEALARETSTMIVTARASYRLNILEGTLTTGAGSEPVDSEQENCARCTRDFVAGLERGRGPAVPGRTLDEDQG